MEIRKKSGERESSRGFSHLNYSSPAKEFYVEDEGGTGRDHAARARISVGHIRRNGEHGALATGHAGHTDIPALDDLARAQDELERLSAVTA